MKHITQSIKTITLALLLSFGLSYVYAWTAPIVTPPGGNVEAPVNTSATSQYKSGALGIGGIIHGYSNAYFDGNVGIGTTAPSDKLQVGGNEQMPRTSYVGSSAGGAISIGTSGGAQVGFIQSGADDILQFFTHHSGVSHAARMTIDRDGNVGVGTAPTASKLQVNGDVSAGGSDWQGLYAGSGGVLATLRTGYGNTVGFTGTDSNHDFLIRTNAVERMRISSSGNVGIGTSAPTAKLDVAGEVKFGNTSSTCNATNEGQQRYNATSKTMEFCNGTAWAAPGGGGGIGVGQTYQNMVGSAVGCAAVRAANVLCTNSTGKPIFVMVTYSLIHTATMGFFVDGVQVGTSFNDDYGSVAQHVNSTISAIVPNGSTYKVSTYTPTTWFELR